MSISRVVSEIDQQLAELDEERDRLLAARIALVGPSLGAKRAGAPSPTPAPKPAPTIEPDEDPSAQPDDPEEEDPEDEGVTVEEGDGEDIDGEQTEPREDVPPAPKRRPGSGMSVLDKIVADGNDHTVDDMVVRAQQLGADVSRSLVYLFFSDGEKAGRLERVAPGRFRARVVAGKSRSV